MDADTIHKRDRLHAEYSAAELFDELVRRGAIDFVQTNEIIEDRVFLQYAVKDRETILRYRTVEQVRSLAAWLAENGVVTTVIHERTVDGDPEELPPQLREMAPGSVMLVSGLFARVPGYGLEDQ